MCLGGTGDTGTGMARGRWRGGGGEQGGTGSAPPAKPGPTLDVRWRRETETRRSGAGGVRGRGHAGQRGGGPGCAPPGRAAPGHRAAARGGPPPGYTGVTFCCLRHIPRQLCPATRAGSARHLTDRARERTGIARPRNGHGTGTTAAPALRGHRAGVAPARVAVTPASHGTGIARPPCRGGRGPCPRPEGTC